MESVADSSEKLLMLLLALLRGQTESAKEDVVLSLGRNELREGNGEAVVVGIDQRLGDLLHVSSFADSATKPK